MSKAMRICYVFYSTSRAIFDNNNGDGQGVLFLEAQSPCKTKLSDFRAKKNILLAVIVINHSSLEYWKLWLLAKKYIKCSLILIFFFRMSSNMRITKVGNSACNSYADYSYTPPLFIESFLWQFSQFILSNWLAIYRSGSWGTVASDLLGTSKSMCWKAMDDLLNGRYSPQLPVQCTSLKMHLLFPPFVLIAAVLLF